LKNVSRKIKIKKIFYKLEPKNLEFIVIIIPPIQNIKNNMIKIFPFPVVFESAVVVPVMEIFESVLGVKDIVLKVKIYLITRSISSKIIRVPINPSYEFLYFYLH